MNLTIGITCNSFKNSGGMERYTLDLVNGFVKKGIRVVIFTQKADFNLPESKLVEIVIVPCKFILGKLRPQYFSWRLKSLKKKHPVDVMIGCCRTLYTDLYICGGTHPGFLRETKKKVGFFDKLTCAFEEKVYRGAKKIVAHSDMIRKEIEEFYPSCKDKTVLLYPAVNLEKFKVETLQRAPTENLRQKFGIACERLLYVFVSSSHERKGFNLLREFFEKTDLPVSLLVCGRPLPKGSYKNIYYLGYLNDLERIYPQCDFAILASTYEPFGLVGIESVAMNTPLIASNKLGCTEVISEDCMLLFNPHSINSLEEVVKYSVDNVSALKSAASGDLDSKFKFSLGLENHILNLLEVCKFIIK